VTSAVDTNVLVALFTGTEREAEVAALALSDAARKGGLVICGAVYAELLAAPNQSEAELETFLTDTKIGMDWPLDREIWSAAGRAYYGYAERRRRQKGDAGPRRILADFVIGAHATNRTDRLLTTDPQLYQTNFRDLELIVP